MNDDQFRKLLDQFGLSWQGYRKVRKGVIKRLVRHMQQLGIRDADIYLERIQSMPEIRQETQRLMTVSISRFFRDRSLWEYIKEKLIPEILSRNPDQVNVWSAGCALGQEVYSFKMLWLLLDHESGQLPPLSLIGTDVSQEYLDMAVAGVFSDHVIKEIPADYLKRFFQYDQAQYFIAQELKQNITWQLHDFTDTAPVNGPFHMIFLRNNLLTYYKKDSHEGPIRRLTETLTTGGYLIIGAHEKLLIDAPKLIRIDDYPGIYLKT